MSERQFSIEKLCREGVVHVAVKFSMTPLDTETARESDVGFSGSGSTVQSGGAETVFVMLTAAGPSVPLLCSVLFSVRANGWPACTEPGPLRLWALILTSDCAKAATVSVEAA